jgi:hypothetical protein
VRNPSEAQQQAPQQAPQRGVLGCLGVIAALVILGAISSFGKKDNGSDTSGNNAGPEAAFIGNRAVATLGPVVACPEWEDYSKIIADLVSHDRVGEDQDFRRGGCTTITKGDTGLVIDSGFDSVRVRLDQDGEAYWTERMFGNPMQPLFVCISGSGKCGP